MTNLPLLQNADTNLLTELTDCLQFEMFQPGKFLFVFVLVIFSELTMFPNPYFVLSAMCFNEKLNGTAVGYVGGRVWGPKENNNGSGRNGMQDLTIFK